MQYLTELVHKFEQKPPNQFTGRYEIHFVFYSILFFFITRIIGSTSEPLAQIIYVGLVSTICYLSILMVATNQATAWIQSQLAANAGKKVMLGIAVISSLYQIIGSSLGLTSFIDWNSSLTSLFWPGSHWVVPILIGGVAFYIGVRTVVFLALLREDRKSLIQILKSLKSLPQSPGETKNLFYRQERDFSIHFIALLVISPFILLQLGIGYYSLLAPIGFFVLFLIAKSPRLHENTDGLSLGDLLTTGLGAGVAILYQATFSLMWCFSLPIAAILTFHTTKLGREHFHFSFVPASYEEIPDLINTVLFTIVTFIPIAILIGFIDLSDWNPNVMGLTIIQYMGVWVYLVGISEEFIFRCGILIFIADSLKHTSQKKNWANSSGFKRYLAAYPVTFALFISAFIFGIAHAPKGWDYAFLACLAGIIYGLPFAKNKNLFGAIILHAIVDVIAVAYFSAAL